MALLANTMKISNKSIDIPQQKSLVNLIESVSNNKLSLYYPEHHSVFIRKIDQLNLSFYIETEKILSKKKGTNTESQGQDTLLLLLFKQINLYISEIERLNIQIKEYEEKTILMKNEVKEERNKRRTEMNTKDQIISTLRTSNNALEVKLLEQIRRSNTLIPCSSNSNRIYSIDGLKIERFFLCCYSSKYTCNRDSLIMNNNDSYIINGANVHNNKTKPVNYFSIRYNSKEEKPNESITPSNKKKIGNYIQKGKGLKIIKNVKAQYSQLKVDSIELHSSEREMNGRISSDITDCNNTVYMKSQRAKQKKIVLDSYKGQYKR